MADSTPSDDDRPEPNLSAHPTGGTPVILKSQELFQGQKEVLILHGQEVYRLRQTRLGKLILQK